MRMAPCRASLAGAIKEVWRICAGQCLEMRGKFLWIALGITQVPDLATRREQQASAVDERAGSFRIGFEAVEIELGGLRLRVAGAGGSLEPQAFAVLATLARPRLALTAWPLGPRAASRPDAAPIQAIRNEDGAGVVALPLANASAPGQSGAITRSDPGTGRHTLALTSAATPRSRGPELRFPATAPDRPAPASAATRRPGCDCARPGVRRSSSGAP